MNPGIISVLGKFIDRVIPNKEAAAQAKLEMLKEENTQVLAEINAASDIITSEAKSEHWLVAAWRPITMLVFVAIIANNYIIYPYLSLFFEEAPVLAIPKDMWDLLKIGLGGYITGRTMEKVSGGNGIMSGIKGIFNGSKTK